VPQPDAIFAQMTEVTTEADAADDVLRVSMDAKATVKVGPFARGGKSRTGVQAADHDVHPAATVTPVGLFLPQTDELFLYGVTSKVTSDCLVDTLTHWWEAVKARFAHVRTLLLTLDNGPETHSRRTQFLHRIVQFAQHSGLTIRLAYYPPYHSTDNAVERCWGVLENHWTGDLLDSVDAVLRCAASMTGKGRHPVVELVTTIYTTGVRLAKDAMAAVEAQVERRPDVPKWFVDVPAPPGSLLF